MAPIRPAKGSKKSKASEASGRRTVNCENTPPPSSTKAPTIRRSLTERYKVLEKKLEETTEQLEKETASRKAAEKNILKNTKNTAATETIPRPAGSVNDKYSLIVEMGLEGEKAQFKAMQRDIRDLVHTARLDMKLDYRKQSVTSLGNLFSVARDVHPYLARFENDWATGDIVKQYLRNRRKYMARQSKQIVEESKVTQASKVNIEETDDEEASNESN